MFDQQALIQKLIEVVKIDSELKQADAVICMSQVLKQACESVGVSPGEILVLGNRVLTTRFRMETQENADPRIIRALFVGRLVEQKNIHGAARALRLLKDQGWQIRFEVCGGKGMIPYLKESLSVLEPGDWTYHANVPNRELPELYRIVDMYVGPSFFEGFQIPLIEALASGKPCVASNQPPASEIISPELGALVEPDDPASIAAGILDVKQRLNDSDVGPQLRVRCREEALSRWDFHVKSRQEAALYNQVLTRY